MAKQKFIHFVPRDRTLTVKNSQDVEPILKKNKRMYNDGDGYSASKDLKRVASIPTLALKFGLKNIMVLITGLVYQQMNEKKFLKEN